MGSVPSSALALTATQQGIWLAEQLEPGESGYHDTAVSRIVGDLDADALRAALADVQRHHEALRCRIETTADGVPTQVFDVDRVDWSYRRSARPDTPVERLVGLDSSEPFDLGSGPLWRVRLVRTGPAEHILIVVTHHLVTDGWSHGVFLRTLLACYLARTRGIRPALPDPGLRYGEWIADKLRRERDARQSDRVDRAAARLVDAPRRWSPPGLTAGPAGRRAALVPVPLSAAECETFRQACRGLGVTTYMGLAGLFALGVARGTGVGEVVLAAPVAHRADPRTAALMGCMIEVVPVHVRVDPALPAREAATAGRAATLEALRHLDVPYREVTRALRVPPGDEDPLTNLSFEEFNVPLGRHRLAGLEIEPLPRVGLRTRHDLTLSVPAGLARSPELLVPADRWQPGTVAAFATDLADLVRACRPA
ncbi:condensation domain-containing protein [Micromonospora nigra]|uniref:condensation domain-containing protein n=1 Tax=Micromonospora nigra TaxID=145857 RepID=UPI001585E49B|nr:condensation domain-containing protein [Micromonospora nigra]